MISLDLINWTLREAQLLNRVDGSREGADSDDPSSAARNAEQTPVEGPVAAPHELRPSPDTTNTDLPATHDAAAPTLAKADASPAPLLKAIVEPGIDTSREDRSRAISLRWVLRDIKNDRLKSWPIEQDDLRLLIGFGLVEMRDDKPSLTNAGVDAVI